MWAAAILLLFAIPMVSPTPRPNIAVVIVDDLAMDAMAIYRQTPAPVKAPQTLGLHKLFKHIPTPHIDQMAKDGVIFTRAYTASPICSPSRYSLMTGKYPSRSASAKAQSLKHPNAWTVTEGMGIANEQRKGGVMGDGSRVFVYNHFNVWVGAPPKEEFTVAHALREAGYRTGLVGKWHLSWRQADPHACSLSASEYDDERELIANTGGFDVVDALHTCNIQSSTKKGMRFSHNPEFTLHHAQRFVNESTTLQVPWFLYMGLTLPHPPNARLALTKYGVGDTPAGPGKWPAWQQYQAQSRRLGWRETVGKAADDAVTAAIASGYKGSWEKNSHNSAAVAWLDAVTGEWLGWLKGQELLDNTLVVFTADHGLMGKRTCTEQGIRVPLIFRGPPQLFPPGLKVHQLVALHDLPATFLHLARARTTAPGNRQAHAAIRAILDGDGASIWPTLGNQAVREAVFCEIGYDRAAVGMSGKLVSRDFDPDRTINTGVAAHRATHQLYNLTLDPSEVDNLLTSRDVVTSQDQRLVKVHARLAELLRGHISATKMFVKAATKAAREERKDGAEEVQDKLDADSSSASKSSSGVGSSSDELAGGGAESAAIVAPTLTLDEEKDHKGGQKTGPYSKRHASVVAAEFLSLN